MLFYFILLFSFIWKKSPILSSKFHVSLPSLFVVSFRFSLCSCEFFLLFHIHFSTFKIFFSSSFVFQLGCDYWIRCGGCAIFKSLFLSNLGVSVMDLNNKVLMFSCMQLVSCCCYEFRFNRLDLLGKVHETINFSARDWFFCSVFDWC